MTPSNKTRFFELLNSFQPSWFKQEYWKDSTLLAIFTSLKQMKLVGAVNYVYCVEAMFSHCIEKFSNFNVQAMTNPELHSILTAKIWELPNTINEVEDINAHTLMEDALFFVIVEKYASELYGKSNYVELVVNLIKHHFSGELCSIVDVITYINSQELKQSIDTLTDNSEAEQALQALIQEFGVDRITSAASTLGIVVHAFG